MRDWLAGVVVGGILWTGFGLVFGYRLGVEDSRSTQPTVPACPTVERKVRIVMDGCTLDRLETRPGDRYFEARMLTRAEERR